MRVAARVLPTILFKPTGAFTQPIACGRLGFIDKKAWDAYARTLLPQLRSLGVTPRTFPLFLFANVVMFYGESSNCCEFGYHSAFNSEGIQTYGVANYDSSGHFKDFPDVSVLSHELAEWYDDPFVSNFTPSWGHTGQVKNCQATLEVGDPLSGKLSELHEVPMPNGVTYHPQELAFFSWFFNQVPSLGFDGWYSSRGTFLTPAKLCN